MEKVVVAAFQTWHNGGLQTSAFYSGEPSPEHGLTSAENQARMEAFIASHYESGTFATLHTFASLEDAKREWNKICDLQHAEVWD